MQETQLTLEKASQFILAGKAIFTIVSRSTGNRFTYKISRSKDNRMFFVALLNGADNTSNYGYLGFIRAQNPKVFHHGRERACAGIDAQSVKAFSWFWKNSVFPYNGVRSDAVEVYHCGHCGRCGRLLTVPESIESGMGPECSKKG